MLKHYLLLIISLFFIAACSSQNEQDNLQKQAPEAAIQSMDSSVIKEESELNKSKTLKRAPIILINPEDDDMTRLD